MSVQTVPVRGDHVKVFLRGGLVEEGLVLLWSDTRSVLKSLSSENILIIQNTDEDVIAVKISVRQKQEPRLISVRQKQESRLPVEVADTEELVPDRYYRNERLRAENLAQLRLLKAQEERKRARALLTTFRPAGLGPARYGLPSKIQSVPFDTKKETRQRH